MNDRPVSILSANPRVRPAMPGPKLGNFLHEPLQFLEIVAQCWPSAEQCEGVSQVFLGVGEYSIVLVALCEACKVNTRTEWVPHILVPLFWFLTILLRSRQLVGGNDKDSMFVAVSELLVEAGSDLAAVSFKQQLCDVHVFCTEGVFDAKLLASDELSSYERLVRFFYRDVLASPVDFVCREDAPQSLDELRFATRSDSVQPADVLL